MKELVNRRKTLMICIHQLGKTIGAFELDVLRMRIDSEMLRYAEVGQWRLEISTSLALWTRLGHSVPEFLQ